MSNSQTIHFMNFSWDLRHLLLDTIPTLLRCNDSFVHPSRRMHPTQKFVRRHQHDLTSAQVRTPADFVSHHSKGYYRVTAGSEDVDALEASCSNRTVFLKLSGCSSPAASDPHLPMCMSLILSSSCLVFCGVTPAHHLCSRAPEAHLLHLAQLELFSSL